MWVLKLIWRVIWNIKTVLITTFVLISLALNIVLFLGGSLFYIVNNGFEALTGIQTIALRNKAEISELSEEVIIERNAKREIRGQLTETTADLADTQITKEKLERETRRITANFVAERRLKQQLKTQVADISGKLATVKLANKTLNEKSIKQADELAIERKAKATLQSELVKKTSELTEEKIINRSLRSIASLGNGVGSI